MNKKNLHYIDLLLSILLIHGISLANIQTVTVNFLLVQFKLPLIILILLCVLLGAFVMTLVNFSKGFSLKKELKSTQKQLEEEKKEIKTEDADFDTDYHEAVAMVPGMGDDKKGKVLDCVQKGYTLNDKVIRHAKVAVGQ